MTWSLVHATTWTGGPVAPVGPMQVLQDGWQDSFGDYASINASNELELLGYGFGLPLLRPQSENARDVLVDVLLNAPLGGAIRAGVTVRSGEADPTYGYPNPIVPFYAFELHIAGSTAEEQYVRWKFYIDDVYMGSEVAYDFPFKALVPFEAGHSYRMVCSVVGGSITVGRVFVRDLTDNVDLIGTTAADVDDIIYVEATHWPDPRIQVPGRIGLATDTAASNFGNVSTYSQPVTDPAFPPARGRG